MPSNRRIGSENAPARTALLDAAERVISQEGYAAMASRRIAEEAGLKQQLVYYYFRTMEELICATFRRRAQASLDRMTAAFASERPLRAFWELNCDGSARLFTEFMSLAHRNEALHAEVVAYSAEANRIQEEAFGRILAKSGHSCPPLLAAFMIASISRNLATERELGILACSDEIKALIEEWLHRLEPEPEIELA